MDASALGCLSDPPLMLAASALVPASALLTWTSPVAS